MKKPTTLNELFSEEESLLSRRAKERAEHEREYSNRPEVIARRQAEVEKEIRQGLRDANGDWIDPPEAEDADEDEDEDDQDDAQ
jgi:hypothetical protein